MRSTKGRHNRGPFRTPYTIYTYVTQTPSTPTTAASRSVEEERGGLSSQKHCVTSLPNLADSPQ